KSHDAGRGSYGFSTHCCDGRPRKAVKSGIIKYCPVGTTPETYGLMSTLKRGTKSGSQPTPSMASCSAWLYNLKRSSAGPVNVSAFLPMASKSALSQCPLLLGELLNSWSVTKFCGSG